MYVCTICLFLPSGHDVVHNMYAYTYVLYARIYAYMYLCIYVCMYVCTCMYIYA